MNFLGLKKMILKSKDFVMKKLDELEIERQELDYVAEQIPKRLHNQLKIFEHSEIDIEPPADYSQYYKIYPNHPVAPLLSEEIKKQKEQINFQLKPALQEHQAQIPSFDKNQQQKAFRLKRVVDNYKEPVPQLSNTMVGIYVVHFHHKRGTEVEFRYPDTPEVQSLESRIVHYAMPDSSHNKHEDYNFFNMDSQIQIQGEKRMLFGVSYFKQIKITQEMRGMQQDLTRSHLQKAVCIVSVLPVFGYLKMRLAQTTKLFFENFTNFQSIKHAYQDITKHLNQTWTNLDVNELYIGSDLKNIIKIFGYKLMEIYKAILYQKRIVIFSHSPSSSSSFILSLLTLFPGMITFGMSSKPINKYYEALREFALPLRLFSKKNPLIISFHIQQFHLLDGFQKPSGRHFLVGTTNRLVKQSKKFSTQVLLNLQDCTLELINIDEGGWQGLTLRDKQFMNEIIQVVSNSNSDSYKGSQDWIRQQFHNYLKQGLTKIVQAKNIYRKFIKQCEIYQASVKNKAKGGDPTVNANQQKLDVPYINQKILDIPFAPLLTKSSFAYFLQFHNPNIYLLSSQYSVQEILLLGSNDYYLGKLPKTESSSVHYNSNSRKLRYSDADTPTHTKQIKFDLNDKIVSMQVGRFYQSHLVQGFRLNELQCYSGDLKNGQYHGYGKLSTKDWTYIGNFLYGKFHGQGQLVNKNKQIYQGKFKNGLKEGKGRDQSQETLKIGQFRNNQIVEGDIQYNRTKVKISGTFKDEKIEEHREYTYQFSNGDVYSGRLKDGKPHGQGIFFAQKAEEPTTALFQFGQFVRIIKKSDQLLQDSHPMRSEVKQKDDSLRQEMTSESKTEPQNSMEEQNQQLNKNIKQQEEYKSQETSEQISNKEDEISKAKQEEGDKLQKKTDQ